MKKILSILLCIILSLSCLVGCKDNVKPTLATGEQISRGAWIKMLSEGFCLKSSTEEPYFSDVSKKDELFNSVQACADLGIIQIEKTFNKNNSVSYKEIALTSVNAIGIDTVSDYLKIDSPPSETALLAFAVNNGIVSDSFNKFASVTDAENALKVAIELYTNRPTVEKENVIYNDGVLNLSKEKIAVSNTTFTYEKASTLKLGDIVILPATQEYPGGLARKVASISGTKVETSPVNLEDVYQTLQVSSVTAPTLPDIIPVNNGITIEEFSKIETITNFNDLNISTPIYNHISKPSTVMPAATGAAFNVNINLTKGKLSIDETWGTISSAFSETSNSDNSYPQFKIDKNGNLYTSKYKSGYEIKGKISISDLSLTNDIDFDVLKGLKKAETKVNFKANINLSIKGKISENIDIFTTQIPIGTTGLWVKCNFSLAFDANGDVSVKCTLQNTTSYTYEKALKSTNNTDLSNKATVAGNISAKIGPQAVLVALGIDLFDIQALVGLVSKAEISAQQGTSEIPCVDIKVYAPTLNIIFAGDKSTLVNSLGFSVNWKVYDIDGGWQKPLTTLTYHFESKNGWVDKCTHPQKTESESTATSSKQQSISSKQQSISSKQQSTSSKQQSTSSASPSTPNKQPSTSSSQNVSSTPNTQAKNWTYKDGGYDYIIKTNGTETIKIPMNMSGFPYENMVDNGYIYKNVNVTRNSIYCHNGYIYFTMDIQYDKEEINPDGGSIGGSYGFSLKTNFYRISENGGNLTSIYTGNGSLEYVCVQDVLGYSKNYVYYSTGDYGVEKNIYKAKLDTNLSNMLEQGNFIMTVGGDSYDNAGSVYKLEIKNEYIYWTELVETEFEDSGVAIQYRCNLDGSNKETVSEKHGSLKDLSFELSNS